jgi:hypothetical protein
MNVDTFSITFTKYSRVTNYFIRYMLRINYNYLVELLMGGRGVEFATQDCRST